MTDIPASLQYLFGPGEIPWAPLPDPRTTPTATPIATTIKITDSYFSVAADETYFADDGPISILFSWDLATIDQYGVIWNQETYGEVVGISSGNIDAVTNYRTIVAISPDAIFRGVYFQSWGLLQNHGIIIAVNKESYAVGYATASKKSWSDVTEHINTGEIIAWSGFYNPEYRPTDGVGATSVALAGGEFFNSGRIAAYAPMYAVGLSAGQGDSQTYNSGLIEAFSRPDGLSIGVLYRNHGESYLENTGTISAGYAVFIDYFYQQKVTIENTIGAEIFGSFYLRNSVDEIINHGLSEGDFFLGVLHETGVTDPATIDTILNTGTIIGDIHGGVDDVFIDNLAGTIIGNILLGDGNDTVVSGTGNESISGGGGHDLLFGGGGLDTLSGGGGNDTLNDEYGRDLIFGDDGRDILNGGPGNDTLYGGVDDDKLIGHLGADDMHGGDGNDTLTGWDDNDVLYGDDGDDAARGGFGDDTVYGGNGRDKVIGNNGYDVLYGGEHNDTLSGWDEDDILFGENGNDALRGGVDNDTLYGGAGNDKLAGNDGDDVLYGEAGDDRFVFYMGEDNNVIMDFTAGEATDDVIELLGFGDAFDIFEEVMAAASQIGDDVVIDFGGGDSITLVDTTLANLHQDDFLFG